MCSTSKCGVLNVKRTCLADLQTLESLFIEPVQTKDGRVLPDSGATAVGFALGNRLRPQGDSKLYRHPDLPRKTREFSTSFGSR